MPVKKTDCVAGLHILPSIAKNKVLKYLIQVEPVLWPNISSEWIMT